MGGDCLWFPFALWKKLFAEEEASPWREFTFCYKIVRHKDGMLFFQARDKRRLFSSLPSSNKSWHKRFFLCRGKVGNTEKKIHFGSFSHREFHLLDITFRLFVLAVLRCVAQ